MAQGQLLGAPNRNVLAPESERGPEQSCPPTNVRIWGQPGKHLLSLSLTGFDPNATSHSSSTSRTHRQSGLYPVVISYSEERNTKTATVTATPTPTPKPAPTATPMPMLATAAPTPAPSTTPTNTLNGKAATPQREIFVPWLRFFLLTVIVPDTGLTRQYQSIRLVSFKPWRNAARRCSVPSGDVLRRKPIIGTSRCCARATSGHAAAPPKSAINSRRPILRNFPAA